MIPASLLTSLTQPLYRALPGQEENEEQPQEPVMTVPLVVPLLGAAAIGGRDQDDHDDAK